MCNVGNIRKMKIMFPNLKYKQDEPSIAQEDLSEDDLSESDMPDWTFAKHRPRLES